MVPGRACPERCSGTPGSGDAPPGSGDAPPGEPCWNGGLCPCHAAPPSAVCLLRWRRQPVFIRHLLRRLHQRLLRGRAVRGGQRVRPGRGKLHHSAVLGFQSGRRRTRQGGGACTAGCERAERRRCLPTLSWHPLPRAPAQGCAYAVSIPQTEDGFLSTSDSGTVCDDVSGCVEWVLSDLADASLSSYLLDAYISGRVGEPCSLRCSQLASECASGGDASGWRKAAGRTWARDARLPAACLGCRPARAVPWSPHVPAACPSSRCVPELVWPPGPAQLVRL